jgi:hypothetical protein
VLETKVHNKLYKSLSFVFTGLLIVSFLYFLAYDYEFNEGFFSALSLLKQQSSNPIIYIVLLLVGVNWGIEALKWQYLVRNIKPQTFYQSIRSVLVGLAAGFFSPRSIGDYISRIATTDTRQRAKLSSAILVNRTSQFCVTMSFGLVGLCFYSLPFINSLLWPALVVLVFLFLVLLVWWQKWHLIGLKKWQFLNDVYLQLLNYPLKAWINLFVMSTLRHLTYGLQFMLVVQVLEPNLSLPLLFFPVMMVYFAKSCIPSIGLVADLGIRELWSIYFLGFCGVAPETALLAGLFIWLVNILLPTFTGAILVWKK